MPSLPGPVRLRVPLGAQVGLVAVLFLAALVVLWVTGASVVARERERASAKARLKAAGGALEALGLAPLAEARRFDLMYPEDRDRAASESALADASAKALGGYRGLEGGYFALGFKSFLGTSGPVAGPAGKAEAPRRETEGERGEWMLPEPEGDLIEIQVDASIRKRRQLFAVSEVEGARPTTVALRTAPVVDPRTGEVVGATWVMTRLVDPVFLDRSLRGYRLAAALALGGLALAFLLTAGLARTVRRQAAERDRLQGDLRRSERLAALGKLLAGVAHEVRNPLAGIRSTVQLWQRGIGPDGESFAGLLDEVDRLDGIVARLLHFSRANTRELAPGDLNALAAEAARLARGPAEAQGVGVDLDLDPSLPAVAMVPPALVQVLRNLTTNALQAMPGPGRLRIATRYDAPSRSAELTVSDTGPGLPAEASTHLFEPFFTTKPGGTGLGLAIAREIALAHGGDLRAGPRPDGPGAAFTLALPALDGRRAGPAAPTENGAPSHARS